MQKYKRRKKLIQPRLQLKLIGSFVGLAALAMMLQFLLLGMRLSSVASNIPDGGAQLADEVPGVLVQMILFSFGVLLPIIAGFGILITHRIAGPVYRFEQWLGQLIRGETSAPCKIREGDEMQELCRLLNEATEPLRKGAAEEPSDTEELRAAS